MKTHDWLAASILVWLSIAAVIANKAERIGFVHVPKCAGSSFFSVLLQVTINKSVEIYPPRSGTSFNAPGCTTRLHGGVHCGYSDLYPCLNLQFKRRNHSHSAFFANSDIKDLKFVTIIRDPADRMVSEYFWWAPCNEKSWSKAVCNLNLTDWMRSPHNTARNRLTKMLVDVHGMMEYRQETETCVGFSAQNAFAYWLRYYLLQSKNNSKYPAINADNLEDIINNDDKLLENAKANIRNNFIFVGVQEHMEASINRLAAIFSFKNTSALHINGHLHSSVEKDSYNQTLLGAIDRAEIRQLNRLDYALYEWVLNTYFSNDEQ